MKAVKKLSDYLALPAWKLLYDKHVNKYLKNIIQETDTRPYKVYTALLTQSFGDEPQSLSSGAVTKGVTYLIDGASNISDFSNVGGPPPGTNNEYFVATNSDVPDEYDGATLIYNTGAPVVTVLENTIGNIWFTYNMDGQYVVNSNGLFINNKTTAMIGAAAEGILNAAFCDTIYSTNNLIYISTALFNGSGFFGTNGELFKTPIEIRVYN